MSRGGGLGSRTAGLREKRRREEAVSVEAGVSSPEPGWIVVVSVEEAEVRCQLLLPLCPQQQVPASSARKPGRFWIGENGPPPLLLYLDSGEGKRKAPSKIAKAESTKWPEHHKTGT